MVQHRGTGILPVSPGPRAGSPLCHGPSESGPGDRCLHHHCPRREQSNAPSRFLPQVLRVIPLKIGIAIGRFAAATQNQLDVAARLGAVPWKSIACHDEVVRAVADWPQAAKLLEERQLRVSAVSPHATRLLDKRVAGTKASVVVNQIGLVPPSRREPSGIC